MVHHNNFDLIRLAAALQVALLHASEHLHAPLGPVGDFLALFPGVPIFFFMSGMLVTASALRRPLRDYAEARARRIIPALWLAFALALITLTAFGQIGRAETESPVFWAWVASQLTVFQVFNPAMFRDFGVGAVNGSLWTIPVEVGFYMLLPALIYVAKAERKAMTALFAVGAVLTFLVGYAVRDTDSLPLKIVAATPLAHFWLFAIGALAYLHLDRLKLARVPWFVPLGAYAAAAYLARPILPEIVWAGLGTVMLCAAVLWAGLAAPVVVGVLRGNDVSYGIYVYHMLAVNALLALGLTGCGAVVAALLVSLAAAFLSWNLAESTVLRRAHQKPVTFSSTFAASASVVQAKSE